MFIIGGGCMNILVGVSNRHVHLTKNIYDKLFSSPMEKLRDLDQPGQFASKQILSIKVGDKIIDDVRVVGPLRDYNQVEISRTDAYFLKVNPPIRESGDIKGSSPITLITSLGEVYLDEGLIIANRHVHLTKDDVEKYGLYNIKEVAIKIKGEKSPLFKYINDGDFVYFVHSYHGTNCTKNTIATTDYGAELTAAVAKDNIFGCQFHPEKSGSVGLSILRAFCEMEV